MGLNELLAGLAVRAAHVLVIEPPGQWSTRVELDHQMLRRGWRRAWTPADADVLARDLVGVVQGGVDHRHPADRHGPQAVAFWAV